MRVRRGPSRPVLVLWFGALTVLVLACGEGPLEDVGLKGSTTTDSPVVTSAAPVSSTVVPTTTALPPTPTTTELPPPEPDRFGWDPVVKVLLTPRGQFARAAASLAAGPAGWLLGVSEDSFEAPSLWFSPDGTGWERVAELPITRSSIGAPVVGVGIDEMVAIKIGDPESAAFGETSELAVWTSPDGTTWIEGDPSGFANSGYLYDLQHTSVGWLAVGESVRNQHDVVPAVYHSDDGRLWKRVLRGDGDGEGAAWAIAEREGQVLVVGSEGGQPMVWRSSDGMRWRASRLPAATHGGEATAGAWLGDRWLVVGAGSETEPMTAWMSPDGASWERVGQLIGSDALEPAFYSRRFGAGATIGDTLVVGARILRFVHENFCFTGGRCFVTVDSLLVTTDGTGWRELPVAPKSFRRGGSDLSGVIAGSDGTLATVTEFDGSIVVWARPGVAGTVPFQGDPPVPELTIERAEWGQELEPGVPYPWSMGTHCGISQLGQFNNQICQLDERTPVPSELVFGIDRTIYVGGFGAIYGIIELTDTPDGQVITFTSGDVVVGVYHPRPVTALRLCA